MELKELETALSYIGPKSNIQPWRSLLKGPQSKETKPGPEEWRVSSDERRVFRVRVSGVRFEASDFDVEISDFE
jgi:hypothetical protein